MSAEVWSPWEPRAGQRVRVRISGECDFKPTLSRHFAGYRGHPAAFHGVTGTVIEMWNPHKDHPYTVLFDPVVGCPLGVATGHIVTLEDGHEAEVCCDSGVFAAIELEPIDD